MPKIGKPYTSPQSSTGASLDTYEQVGEKRKVLAPKSVNSFKFKALKIRTRNALMSRLIGYGLKVDSPNVAHYRAVERCCTTYKQEEGKYLKAEHRCGSKLCPLCSNIRTAKLMELYLPHIDESRNWGFLTLTANNSSLLGCTPDELRKELTRRDRLLDNIRRRGLYEGRNMDCIVSREVTPESYKVRKQNGSIYYAPHHPHFHIFGNYETLEWLREEWIKDIDCTGENQVLKPVLSNKIRSTMKEVLKYSMKPIIVFDNKENKEKRSVNLKGVDDLLTAMKGKRRLSCWGIFYAIGKESKKVETSAIEDLELKREAYFDLPVPQTVSFSLIPNTNKGFYNWNNVIWRWSPKYFNWFYQPNNDVINLDNANVLEDLESNVWLFKWREIPKPYELSCYVGRKKYNQDL